VPSGSVAGWRTPTRADGPPVVLFQRWLWRRLTNSAGLSKPTIVLQTVCFTVVGGGTALRRRIRSRSVRLGAARYQQALIRPILRFPHAPDGELADDDGPPQPGGHGCRRPTISASRRASRTPNRARAVPWCSPDGKATDAAGVVASPLQLLLSAATHW
jgi:hypothetical protein